MASALQKLRNAIVQNVPVEITPKTIKLANGAELDRKALTNLKSMRGRGAPYPLDAVYFNLKFRDRDYNQYIAACNAAGADHVKTLDRVELSAFLSGEKPTCSCLVDEASIPAPAAPATKKEEAVPVPDRGETTPDAGVGSFDDNRWDVREQRSIDSVLMLENLNCVELCKRAEAHIADAKKGKPQTAAEKKEQQKRSEAAKKFDPRGDRYKTDEGRFWREQMGGDMNGINPSGSFAVPSAKARAPVAPKPAPAPEAKPSSRGTKRKFADPATQRPIIIVPGPGSISILNSTNARMFFENGKFMSEETMRNNGIERNLSYQVTATREPGANCSSADYVIVSNAARLTDDEWERVVAVCCTGKEWQFKNWKLGNRPVDVLRKIQGFYFYYSDTKPDPLACTWPIKMMSLERFGRHRDGHAQLEFFRILDQYIQRSGKRLRF